MKAEIQNNQHTLYRFVSLRNPEKFDPKSQETRFVLCAEKELNASQFFQSIINKLTTQTQWQALAEKATTFAAFTSEKEIENLNSTFYQVANWLVKNRTTASSEELLKQVDGIKPLDQSAEINLWDNLFYTVATNKNHYVKEAVIQMLVLQNLLKQNPTLDTVVSLASASVVLPTEIFEDDVIATANSSAEKNKEEIILVSNSLTKAQEIAKAKLTIETLSTIKKELQKIENNQKAVFQKKYNDAQTAHQKLIKPIIDKYNKEFSDAKFKLEAEAQVNKTEINLNLINIPYPELPEFDFNETADIDNKTIKEKLQHQSTELLDGLINWDETQNIEEIYTTINQEIETANTTIIENTTFSTQYATYGDVIIPVKETSNPFNFSTQICVKNIKQKIELTFTIQVPNTIITAAQMLKLVFIAQNGDRITKNVAVNATTISNVVSFTISFTNDIETTTNPIVALEGQIYFSNNKIYTINANPFDLKTGCKPPFAITAKEETNTNVAPQNFGFRQIGIADYKKVVTEICGYRAGEVAHIENVMASEFRSKNTTKTHKSEVTNFESQEIETEKLSDTTTTERFEMQTEIAKMQQEQTAIEAHANVHASGLAWSLDAGASYATNTTKEESNRQAVINAKEQTERAVERIVSRIKNEKTVKITDEFIEANSHIFDNRISTDNVSGVYRFINAVYKNQIYNYGKRLMYEFMVPQPSKLHRLGLQISTADTDAIALQKPIDPRIAFPSFTAINSANYQVLLANYGVKDAKAYPEQQKSIGKTFINGTSIRANESAFKNVSENADLEIPAGYQTKYAKAIIYARYNDDSGIYRSFGVTIGNMNILYSMNNGDPLQINFDSRTTPQYVGGSTGWVIVPLEVFTQKISVGYQIGNMFALNCGITILCELTQEAITNWQKETYQAILQGYNDQLEAYNQQLASIKAQGTALLDSNPLFYRQTEQLILRKNCISYLIDNTNTASAHRFGLEMYNTGANFTNHQVTLSQTMDDYTNFAKFMEQAFEWNLMSYNFYPFYWGNSVEWKDLYQFETNDATYRNFMQAGMARVVVTVKPGFEKALMHYMATGQIWNGGQTPILGNPLYLSIVDELTEQEYVVEDIWETVLPTNLVALQEKGVSIAGGGLPNAESCAEHKDKTILLNDKTLGVVLPTK